MIGTGCWLKPIPELGQHFTTAHGNRCCVPYDPSIQLLFYRRDLFTDPTYKRMYYEDFREELAVPKTFRDYNRVASFFTRGCNAASPTQYGSTVAIGNVVVSPSEFMPRLLRRTDVSWIVRAGSPWIRRRRCVRWKTTGRHILIRTGRSMISGRMLWRALPMERPP